MKYPGMAVPFYGSGIGGEELETIVKDKTDTWIKMYTDVLDTYVPFAGEDFIKGFGEVETQEWDLSHNDPKIMRLIDIANNKTKHFMFHPVAKKIDDVKAIIEKYPDTIFLIHMYREDVKNAKQKLIDMLKGHDNLYFSIDAAHIIHFDGNDILYSYADQYGNNAKSRFITTVNSDYDAILDSAVAEYKGIVQNAPDKVMWGTEAGPAYSFEPEAYDLLVKASRDFIAKVTQDAQVREALAYKNALRVFGPGVTLQNAASVINTDSWPLCDMSDIDEECGYCGVGDDDEEFMPEAEACENDCIVMMQCIDPVEVE